MRIDDKFLKICSELCFPRGANTRHSLIPGKTERRFWAELSAHISSICAEFVQKNSIMVPHHPLYKPIPLFSDHKFMDSTYFPLISGPSKQGKI